MSMLRSASQPCANVDLEIGSTITASCPCNVFIHCGNKNEVPPPTKTLDHHYAGEMPTDIGDQTNPTDSGKTCVASERPLNRTIGNRCVEACNRGPYGDKIRQEVPLDTVRAIRYLSQPVTDTNLSVEQTSAKRLQDLWDESLDVALSLKALCLERPRKRFCAMSALTEESVGQTGRVTRVDNPEAVCKQKLASSCMDGAVVACVGAIRDDSLSGNDRSLKRAESNISFSSTYKPCEPEMDVAERRTRIDKWIERLDGMSRDDAKHDCTRFLSQQMAKACISDLRQLPASQPVGGAVLHEFPPVGRDSPPVLAVDRSDLSPPERTESAPHTDTSLHSPSQESGSRNPVSPRTASHLAAVVSAAMAAQHRQDDPRAGSADGRRVATPHSSPSPGSSRSSSPARSEAGSGGRYAGHRFRYSQADTVPCSPNDRPDLWARVLSSQTDLDALSVWSQEDTEARLPSQANEETCLSSQAASEHYESNQVDSDSQLSSQEAEDVGVSSHVSMGPDIGSQEEIPHDMSASREPLSAPADRICSQSATEPASPSPPSGQSDLTGYIVRLVDGVETGSACPADTADPATGGRPDLSSLPHRAAARCADVAAGDAIAGDAAGAAGAAGVTATAASGGVMAASPVSELLHQGHLSPGCGDASSLAEGGGAVGRRADSDASPSQNGSASSGCHSLSHSGVSESSQNDRERYTEPLHHLSESDDMTPVTPIPTLGHQDRLQLLRQLGVETVAGHSAALHATPTASQEVQFITGCQRPAEPSPEPDLGLGGPDSQLGPGGLDPELEPGGSGPELGPGGRELYPEGSEQGPGGPEMGPGVPEPESGPVSSWPAGRSGAAQSTQLGPPVEVEAEFGAWCVSPVVPSPADSLTSERSDGALSEEAAAGSSVTGLRTERSSQDDSGRDVLNETRLLSQTSGSSEDSAAAADSQEDIFTDSHSREGEQRECGDSHTSDASVGQVLPEMSRDCTAEEAGGIASSGERPETTSSPSDAESTDMTDVSAEDAAEIKLTTAEASPPGFLLKDNSAPSDTVSSAKSVDRSFAARVGVVSDGQAATGAAPVLCAGPDESVTGMETDTDRAGEPMPCDSAPAAQCALASPGLGRLGSAGASPPPAAAAAALVSSTSTHRCPPDVDSEPAVAQTAAVCPDSPLVAPQRGTAAVAESRSGADSEAGSPTSDASSPARGQDSPASDVPPSCASAVPVTGSPVSLTSAGSLFGAPAVPVTGSPLGSVRSPAGAAVPPDSPVSEAGAESDADLFPGSRSSEELFPGLAQPESPPLPEDDPPVCATQPFALSLGHGSDGGWLTYRQEGRSRSSWPSRPPAARSASPTDDVGAADGGNAAAEARNASAPVRWATLDDRRRDCGWRGAFRPDRAAAAAQSASVRLSEAQQTVADAPGDPACPGRGAPLQDTVPPCGDGPQSAAGSGEVTALSAARPGRVDLPYNSETGWGHLLSPASSAASRDGPPHSWQQRAAQSKSASWTGDEPESASVPRCDEPESASVPRCDEHESASVPRCDEPEPASVARCDEPESASVARCDEPEPASVARCDEPESASVARRDEPESASVARCDASEPASVSRCDASEPASVSRCDASEPASVSRCGITGSGAVHPEAEPARSSVVRGAPSSGTAACCPVPVETVPAEESRGHGPAACCACREGVTAGSRHTIPAAPAWLAGGGDSAPRQPTEAATPEPADGAALSGGGGGGGGEPAEPAEGARVPQPVPAAGRRALRVGLSRRAQLKPLHARRLR